MFATPTFDGCANGGVARLTRTVLTAVAALLLLALAPPRAALADEGPLAEFYSYLPAAPELSMPEIDILFWTDDFKKGKRAYKNGNYKRALKFFRRASDDGNIGADWYLGHMYLTGRGVTVFDKTGKQIEQIEVAEPWTANVTFGGKDRNLLFITASKNVYGLKMRVKGAP